MFSSVNTIWVLLGAALVFFMQAGFAMVEAGFTRAKNSGNIVMKNLMDFCIGTPVFWLLGFGLMFGGTGAFIGGFDPLVRGDYSAILPEGVPLPAFLIFQTVFCATAATIVSGAMAERTKFSCYCIYSLIISAVIYPISGHWIWGGGWLSKLGFHDFAGSTAVHMVGGVAALIGAKILGPRIGKYDKNGKPKAILGHSITLGALGELLAGYQGTILFVSHDRAFRDSVATRMLEFNAEKLDAFEGGAAEKSARENADRQREAIETEISLLQMRLAVLASRMSAPKKGDSPEKLNEEYLALSRELNERKKSLI